MIVCQIRPLISNIGFGVGATHTNDPSNKLANMSVEAIDLPLQHPQFVVRDKAADRSTHEHIFDYSLLTRLKKAIARSGLFL